MSKTTVSGKASSKQQSIFQQHECFASRNVIYKFSFCLRFHIRPANVFTSGKTPLLNESSERRWTCAVLDCSHRRERTDTCCSSYAKLVVPVATFEMELLSHQREASRSSVKKARDKRYKGITQACRSLPPPQLVPKTPNVS